MGIAFELQSADRWRLRCRVESIGRDLECRISGGSAHLGAVALAQWHDERLENQCLEVSGHRERELVLHAAQRLAMASGGTVLCRAGIHFDELTAAEVEAVVDSANRLVRQAARRIERRRLRLSMVASACFRGIVAGAPAIRRELEGFCRLPLVQAIPHDPGRADPEIFAPIYVSDACLNDCDYCGFRRSARFARHSLDEARALRELDHLVAAGHDSIELVSGEIPTTRYSERLARLCAAMHAAHPRVRIGINVGALSSADYARLREAGASGCWIYQESYQPWLYLRVHRSGPKRDFAARLDAPRRAAEAGFERVGLGVLLGLGSWVGELAAMARHAELLRAEFPRVALDFCLPRLRPREPGELLPDRPLVSDDDFVRAFSFLRRRFPRDGFSLSTRESAAMRDRMIPLGVTRLSAGVSTASGGYARGTDDEVGRPQFLIEDSRSRAEIVALLSSRL